MKYFIVFLFFIPLTTIAQVNINFEDSTLNAWETNSPDRWGITATNPLEGNYSLKHIYDNANSGNDQASIRFDRLHLENDTTTWSFSVRYGYSPSSSNNWSAFLLADNQASEMHPDGTACAYILGVNFKGSDDLIKVWKSTGQEHDEIYNTDYNWQDSIGTETIVDFEIIRYPGGFWEISMKKDLDTYNLGSFTDTSILSGNYFGVYYEYSSTQDRKLTLDDISIDGLFIRDTLPPVIQSLEVADSSSINITFSEPVNIDSLKQKQNYFIDGMGIPDSIFITGTDKVHLKFNSGFINENTYPIQIKNITDLNENESEVLIDSFFYYQAVQHDVLITEIHPDPLPVVDLPEFEYIEIFNHSPYNIDLSGWTVQTGRAEKSFPAYQLHSKQRLILCHEDAIPLFSQYGDCIGIFTSLSSLLNTRDTIAIHDQYNNLIDSVSYSDEWHNADKQDGGWSLELTNDERRCMNEANWKSSIHPLGGTPGTLNSVHMNEPDVHAPFIEKSNFGLDSIISFEISEPIDTASLSAFIWQHDLHEVPVEQINDTVFQAYATYPINEGEFTFILQNLTDLCFHTTPADSIRFYHHLPQMHEVVINEFLIDPTPSIDLPDYEFIELLNISEFDINLQNWKIFSGENFYQLPEYVLQAGKSAILTHENAHDAYSTFGNVIPVLSNSYFLSNNGGSLKLESHNNVLIDSLQYNSYYYDQDLDGISLERMHADFLCFHPQNLLPSLNPSGGTPGQSNSRTGSEMTWNEPTLQSINVLDDTTFIIEFSDFVDTTSSVQISLSNNYGISGYHFSSLKSLQIHLDTLLKSMDSLQISLSGIVDFCGKPIDDTIVSVVIYFPNPSDLLITEIMADPLPVQDLPEYEYVEVYNNTGYAIDLAGWSFHTSKKTCDFNPCILPANERLILCHEYAKEHFQPHGRCLDVFKSLSTLLNTNDTILIRDKTGKTIDSVFYSDEWHQNDKNDGGWSLELTHHSRSCQPKANWNSSVSPSGGTPGKINSVHLNGEDNDAPVISNFQQICDTSFLFAFNEPIEENNLIIQCTQDKPLFSVSEMLTDSSVVVHTLTSPTEGNIHFILQKIEDYCFNKTTDTIQFYHHVPFSKEVIINEFMIDPTPGKGLPEYEFIELLNRSNFDINLTGWHIQTGSGSYKLPTFLLNANESVILTHTNAGNDYAYYGETLPVIGSKYFLPNECSHIVLSSGRNSTIDSVYYQTDWYEAKLDGISLERNELDLDCYHPLSIRPSIDPNGGTPGNQNSTFGIKPGISLPQLLHSKWISDTVLQLTFTGFIDTMASAHARIESGYEIKNVSFAGYHTLNICTDKPISSGDTLFLEIQDLTDLCGNHLEKIRLNFTRYDPDEFDLLITEIMADPDPVEGLPNAEYIEILNVSGYPISTESLKLIINDKEIAIIPEILKDDTYYLFVDDDDIEKFQEFDHVHPLPSLNLLNEKNTIVLTNRENEIIHFATTTNALYSTERKRQGGWSLEMSNMINPCITRKQWKESESYLGGTPGNKNSVYANDQVHDDEIIKNIGIPASNNIRIFLNEYLPKHHLDQLEVYISPHINIDTVTFKLNSFSLEIHTREPLISTKQYQLQLKNVIDCQGHIFNSQIYIIGVPLISSPGDILISEVMFDPADGYPEFIEIFNASEKIIDAGDLFLQTGTSNMVRIAIQSTLIFPGEYMLLCENKDACMLAYSMPYDNILEVEPFAALNNTRGYIGIQNKQQSIIDEFHYSADLHHHSLTDGRGVSVERVSFHNPSNRMSNWQSATSIAGYSTPGVQNSKYLSGYSEINEELIIEPEVFTPNNDGEKDMLKIGYQLPEGEYTLNLSVYDPSGRLVRHLIRNEIIASSGTLFWDGMDTEYSFVSTGIYVLFFEAVGSNGKVIRKKETCVLAN